MIREVDINDIPECVNVITESFMTVAEEIGFTAENAPGFTAFALNEERLLRHYKNERIRMYVSYDGDKITGYFSIELSENGECELNNLCVLPGSRHKKTGEKLLQAAFALARENGCKKMNIGIVEENKILRRWYEKHGFLHQGIKKFDFFPFTCGYMAKIL